MKIVMLDEYKKIEKSIPQHHGRNIDPIVLEIIQTVRRDGDKALKKYTEQFDHVTLDTLEVTQEEQLDAYNHVDDAFIQALQKARDNIIHFHQSQVETSWFQYDQEGNMLGQKITPLERVGIYVPGGKACYPSTILMNVVPAKLAGVESINIVTPPRPDGSIDPKVLVAANEVGIHTIYKVGGAQAIAALAYGTETIAKVDKIVGPGNQFVARAKKWVYGDVAIDMIAGPSEICVLADKQANPRFIAADLLSQAEHDEAARAILVTTDETLAKKVQQAIARQIEDLDRVDIIQQSLDQNGEIIVTRDLDTAIKVVNDIAPEHLQVMTENPSALLPFIKHAGAIFLGSYSPEPLGDYMAGPNHTLPTSGTARFASPLGVYDFVKKSSIIHYTKDALLTAADDIMTLAQAEGLTAHASSIRVRKDVNDANELSIKTNK